MGEVININPSRYSRVDASVVDISTGVIFDTTDPDAQAYLTAAAITDPTLVSETNILFLGLKEDGLYGSLDGMYLLLGSTATSCKWNAINPLDTNNAYRLTFTGGTSFSSNGLQFNGTNSYAEPHLNANADLTPNDWHFSFYSRTNNVTTGYEIGSDNDLGMILKYHTGNGYILAAGAIGFANAAASTKLYIATQKTGVAYMYRDGVELHSVARASFGLPGLQITFGVDNRGGGVADFSTKEAAFISFGSGFTSAQSTLFTARVNAFLTNIGRNV